MDLTALKQALADLLKGAPGLAGAEILLAFPAGRHLPLQGASILLGVDALELTSGGLGGLCLGQGGSPASITVRLDIFAPDRSGGDLDQLFEAVCAALAQSAARLGISRIWREHLAWDDGANSYRLSARALLQGRARAGSPREEVRGIEEVRLVRNDATGG